MAGVVVGRASIVFVVASAFAGLTAGDVAAAAKAKSEPAATEQNMPPRGKLTLAYGPSEAFKSLSLSLKKAGILQAYVDHINTGLVVPKDLPVAFAECGQVNAFYRPSAGIVICYEVVRDFAATFLTLKAENAELGVEYDADDALTNALTFVFFHELGHALIDIYDLGTDHEEDDADGLATALLLHLQGGDVAAIHGATALRALAEKAEKAASEQDGGTLPFWDEHSFGAQRFFNIGCWVYGKLGDDELRSALKAEGMSDSRLDRCPTAFRRMKKLWKDRLKSWLIPDKSDTKAAQ